MKVPLFHSLRVARQFRPELRPHVARLVVVGLLSVALAGFGIVRPWPVQWIFDRALVPQGDVTTPFEVVVAQGVGALVVVVLFSAIVDYVRQLQVARIGHQVARGLRFRIFSHLSRLSPLAHAEHKSGDLLVRMMGDVPMVKTMLVDSTVELVTRTVLVVGIVAVMLVKDALLTVSVFATVPVLLVVVRWLSSRIHVAVRKQRRKEGALADYLHEALAATETVQSLGRSGHVVRRFARSNRRSERAGLKAKKLAARLTASVESLLGVAVAGTLLLGSFRVRDGHLTPGELLVFLSYVRSLVKPLRAASKHAARIAQGTACGERILALFTERRMVHEASDARPAPERPRQLVFLGVSFAYGDRAAALTGFDATFERGKLAALVGRSGAGKSTAAALVQRLFDPDEGQLLLDGRPLKSMTLDSLRESVGLALQHSVFFGDTLRENLLLSVPEATDEQLWRALELAGAAPFVRALEDGLETRLGAGGVGLSGGQARRLALARTLLRDAPILIVDEPFAGLDRPTAAAVAETLRELAKDRITIVIAHDFENLQLYHHIVYLEAGRAVDEGRHEELLVRRPAYAELVRAGARA